MHVLPVLPACWCEAVTDSAEHALPPTLCRPVLKRTFTQIGGRAGRKAATDAAAAAVAQTAMEKADAGAAPAAGNGGRRLLAAVSRRLRGPAGEQQLKRGDLSGSGPVLPTISPRLSAERPI